MVVNGASFTHLAPNRGKFLGPVGVEVFPGDGLLQLEMLRSFLLAESKKSIMGAIRLLADTVVVTELCSFAFGLLVTTVEFHRQ